MQLTPAVRGGRASDRLAVATLAAVAFLAVLVRRAYAADAIEYTEFAHSKHLGKVNPTHSSNGIPGGFKVCATEDYGPNDQSMATTVCACKGGSMIYATDKNYVNTPAEYVPEPSPQPLRWPKLADTA